MKARILTEAEKVELHESTIRMCEKIEAIGTDTEIKLRLTAQRLINVPGAKEELDRALAKNKKNVDAAIAEARHMEASVLAGEIPE